MMDAKEYMARRCVCGRTRGEHVHFHHLIPGGITLLRVLPLPAEGVLCAGYLDEFELELQGNPLENRHLSPLVEENLADVRIKQNGPVS